MQTQHIQEKKQTFQDIIKSLELVYNSLTPKEILELFDPEELIQRHTCDPENNSYEREVLFENDTIEVVFCHWKNDTSSVPHFHPGVSCWFKCLAGSLTEKFNKGEKFEEIESDICAGEVKYIDDNMGSHQILNKSGCCCYSLHLYKKLQ